MCEEWPEPANADVVGRSKVNKSHGSECGAIEHSVTRITLRLKLAANLPLTW